MVFLGRMPVVLAIIVVGFFYREVHDVRCIVFVERIVAAVVLASMVNQLSCLSKFIRSESMSGLHAGQESNRNQLCRIIESFRVGQVQHLLLDNNELFLAVCAFT